METVVSLDNRCQGWKETVESLDNRCQGWKATGVSQGKQTIGVEVNSSNEVNRPYGQKETVVTR